MKKAILIIIISSMLLCVGCGIHQDDLWTCSSCGHTNQGGEYCTGCGVARPLSWKCNNCGTTNQPESKYCKQCGKLNDAIVKAAEDEAYAMDHALNKDFYEQEAKKEERVQNGIAIQKPCFILNGTNTTDPIEIVNGSVLDCVNYDSRYIQASGEIRATNATTSGEHIITFTLKDPDSTYWEDTFGDVSEVQLVWIKK